MQDHEKREALITAFRASQFKWRTPRGLSKDTGIPVPQLLDFLEKSDVARRSKKPNNRGEPLFTLADRFYEERPLIQRILGKIVNED